jgi:hypothetical protein
VTVGPFIFGAVDESMIVREQLAAASDGAATMIERQLQQQVDELARRTAALEANTARQSADAGSASVSRASKKPGQSTQPEQTSPSEQTSKKPDVIPTP